MLKPKVIQIQIEPETEDANAVIWILTEDGRIFRRSLGGDQWWMEILTPSGTESAE